MTFTFTILHPEGQIQTFSISSESVEECLIEITPMLKFGRSLLFASFKKRDQSLKILPVKRTDEEAVTEFIRRLRSEWVQIVEES
ncbi:hypothetical protein GCM10027347_41260 [Larkinella harenae]